MFMENTMYRSIIIRKNKCIWNNGLKKTKPRVIRLPVSRSMCLTCQDLQWRWNRKGITENTNVQLLKMLIWLCEKIKVKWQIIDVVVIKLMWSVRKVSKFNEMKSVWHLKCMAAHFHNTTAPIFLTILTFFLVILSLKEIYYAQDKKNKSLMSVWVCSFSSKYHTDIVW